MLGVAGAGGWPSGTLLKDHAILRMTAGTLEKRNHVKAQMHPTVCQCIGVNTTKSFPRRTKCLNAACRTAIVLDQRSATSALYDTLQGIHPR